MTPGEIARFLIPCVLVACAGQDVPPPPAPRAIDATIPAATIDATPDVATPAASDATNDATPDTVPDAGVPSDAVPLAVVGVAEDLARPEPPEVWLKGSTHVHARPSGDSTTPIPDVLRWYTEHAYDFVVLTDHNQVSELDKTAPTPVGDVTLRPPRAEGLIVFAGIELTHNPSNCIPPGDDSGKCRIHVNLLGVTARPVGKVLWANRKTSERLLKYDAALGQQKLLGGVAQLNHPNWFWGMNADLLAELATRGFSLVEIANSAFAPWNAGDKDHPSMEALWDGALAKGATLWGVASDDAHDYEDTGGTYPAGGGWIVVKAQRTPLAILNAIAGGRFYASSGVVLAHAEATNHVLEVEVAAGEKGTYTIELIENGKRVARIKGRAAKRPLPATGYLRAVVTRGDGAKAWVQPARR